MDIRTSQQSNQFAQQTIQMQMQADAIKQKAIMDGEIAKEKERGNQDRLTQAEKIQGDLAVQQLVNSGMIQKNSLIEENKDKRIDKASTNQSEESHRKEIGGDPIDFEAKNAEMKTFEL